MAVIDKEPEIKPYEPLIEGNPSYGDFDESIGRLILSHAAHSKA